MTASPITTSARAPMSALIATSALLLLAASLAACDGGRREQPDAGSPFDGGTVSRSDGAAAVDDGSSPSIDGATGVDSGSPLDGGGVVDDACGEGEASFTGIPRNCDEQRCFDAPRCIDADLAMLGFGDLAPCGTEQIVTEGDSAAACDAGPPLGDWPIPFMCHTARFSGSLRFFCGAGHTITRYRIDGTVPREGMMLVTSYGYDFWEGSGGGSGGNHLHLDEFSESPAGNISFVGYHDTPLPPMGSIQSTIWFIVEPYIGGGPRFIGGGSVTALPPD